MDMNGRILILGAGHAGGTLAALLRQLGWTGPITLAGDEPIAPYQRPPLSKAWLKGEADAESLALRPAGFYAAHDIALRLNLRAESIQRADSGGEVRFSDGTRIPYDKLVLATGSRARRIALPGAELAGVMELRTAADADRLKAAIRPATRLAVIGGGYVGLEAAASARAMGAEVTVIELQQRLLARVAHAELSAFIHDRHQAEGVTIRLGCRIDALEGADGRVSGVRLGDGSLISCDAALIGVGGLPNQELAAAAGLACDDGVVVDLAGRSSACDIYAIGDCTRRPLPLYGVAARLESVPNALEQVKQVAADLCETRPPPPETPWFWSDQFDLKLQIAGLPIGAAKTVLRGEPSTGRFAIFHLNADDQIQAVEAINAPSEFMAGRHLIGLRKSVRLDSLADLSVSMKEVAV
ncbi:MAG: NAD(P)/FAD-dependent oxidoreductase [Caulobacteraceae bacterium]